jgi:hypothetical protein
MSRTRCSSRMIWSISSAEEPATRRINSFTASALLRCWWSRQNGSHPRPCSPPPDRHRSLVHAGPAERIAPGCPRHRLYSYTGATVALTRSHVTSCNRERNYRHHNTRKMHEVRLAIRPRGLGKVWHRHAESPDKRWGKAPKFGTVSFSKQKLWQGIFKFPNFFTRLRSTDLMTEKGRRSRNNGAKSACA